MPRTSIAPDRRDTAPRVSGDDDIVSKTTVGQVATHALRCIGREIWKQCIAKQLGLGESEVYLRTMNSGKAATVDKFSYGSLQNSEESDWVLGSKACM